MMPGVGVGREEGLSSLLWPQLPPFRGDTAPAPSWFRKGSSNLMRLDEIKGSANPHIHSELAGNLETDSSSLETLPWVQVLAQSGLAQVSCPDKRGWVCSFTYLSSGAPWHSCYQHRWAGSLCPSPL